MSKRLLFLHLSMASVLAGHFIVPLYAGASDLFFKGWPFWLAALVFAIAAAFSGVKK